MSTKSELSARAQAILDEITYAPLGPDDLTVEIVREAAAAKGSPMGYQAAMGMLSELERRGELTRFFTIGKRGRRIIAFRVTGKGGGSKRT